MKIVKTRNDQFQSPTTVFKADDGTEYSPKSGADIFTTGKWNVSNDGFTVAGDVRIEVPDGKVRGGAIQIQDIYRDGLVEFKPRL